MHDTMTHTSLPPPPPAEFMLGHAGLFLFVHKDCRAFRVPIIWGPVIWYPSLGSHKPTFF